MSDLIHLLSMRRRELRNRYLRFREQSRLKLAVIVVFGATVWFGLFAPAKTDPAVVAKLNRELVEVLKQPEVRTRLTDMGVRVVGNSPAEFAAFLAKEVQKFSAVVKAANIKAE